MLDPVQCSIEVPCSQEEAFSVFVQNMGSWWPLDKRSMSARSGQPAKSLEVDARERGKIVETSQDGTEHHWGTISSYDPFKAMAMDFHMGLSADMASLVEVLFVVVNENQTRVDLTHSNFEAFGEMAEKMRNGYGSGWVLIFEEAFKEACGG